MQRPSMNFFNQIGIKDKFIHNSYGRTLSQDESLLRIF
jgi:hypothetical protein